MQKPSLSPPNSRRMLLTFCGGLNWSVLVLFTLFLLLSGLLVNLASDRMKSLTLPRAYLFPVMLPYPLPTDEACDVV
ncbi:hypothetical protein [Shewanella oncorhynchi]|uniref:hypothetical protein n=1 Tax=Shewanella oncorhynchi TaxID=2726434 RepID=UPI003D7B06AF